MHPTSPGFVAGDGTHWIDVNLTQQMVYAYSGNTVMNSFLVSTGTWQYPTVTGQYHIYVKLRYTDMSGADYYLPNVPFTMYFYQGYGLHGTYWHHNFGTPMSHGCVNLSIPDSEWLYNFSSVGTARQHTLLEFYAVNCPCSPGASAFSFSFLFFLLLCSFLLLFCFFVFLLFSFFASLFFCFLLFCSFAFLRPCRLSVKSFFTRLSVIRG